MNYNHRLVLTLLPTGIAKLPRACRIWNAYQLICQLMYTNKILILFVYINWHWQVSYPGLNAGMRRRWRRCAPQSSGTATCRRPAWPCSARPRAACWPRTPRCACTCACSPTAGGSTTTSSLSRYREPHLKLLTEKGPFTYYEIVQYDDNKVIHVTCSLWVYYGCIPRHKMEEHINS